MRCGDVRQHVQRPADGRRADRAPRRPAGSRPSRPGDRPPYRCCGIARAVSAHRGAPRARTRHRTTCPRRPRPAGPAPRRRSVRSRWSAPHRRRAPSASRSRHLADPPGRASRQQLGVDAGELCLSSVAYTTRPPRTTALDPGSRSAARRAAHRSAIPRSPRSACGAASAASRSATAASATPTTRARSVIRATGSGRRSVDVTGAGPRVDTPTHVPRSRCRSPRSAAPRAPWRSPRPSRDCPAAAGCTARWR